MHHVSLLNVSVQGKEAACEASPGSGRGLAGTMARKIAQSTSIVLLAAWLGACAVTPPVTQARFDFGALGADHADTQNTTSRAADLVGKQSLSAPSRAVVVVPDVIAPSDLDSDQMRYRLTYLNGQQARSYAASRWTMTPAQLLTQRLRARLAGQGAVLSNAGASSAPVLRVELIEFEQLFDQPNVGRGVISLRATVSRNGVLLAQREFFSAAPAPTPDAAGGAQALAGASDAAIAAVISWFQGQPQT